MNKYNFQKPTTSKVDIGDARIFLLGLASLAEKNGEELPLSLHQEITPYKGILGLKEVLEPFSPERCMDILDLAIAETGPNLISDMPQEMIEAMKKRYADLGMSNAFDDGIITVEELVMAAAARGNAALEQHPEKFHLTEDQITRAEKFLAKHGINDPDGEIAKGFAAQSVRVAQRANEGLGISNNLPPELSTKHMGPEVEGAVFPPSPSLG